MFETATRDQTLLLQSSMLAIRTKIHESQLAVQTEVRTAAEQIELSNRVEHEDTRQIMQNESHQITVSVELAAQLSADQHEELMAEVAALQSTVAGLQEDMATIARLFEAKDQYLIEVLSKIAKATSDKTRRALQADANAITATMIALAEVYRQILVRV